MPKLEAIQAPIENPESFTETGSADFTDAWWQSFDDPVLDSLVGSALEDNLSLSASWEQVLAARARFKQQASFLWPDISARAQNAISRPEPDFAGGENVQIGLAASYEVDLWGRLKSAKQAAAFRAQAGFFDYRAAAMTVSSEISLAYFRMLTARQQLQLIDDQIATNEDILRLIRIRFGSGQVRAVDILRQEQLLQATRSLRIDYEQDFAVFKNQLMVLLGRPPQNTFEVDTTNLPEMPPVPATGLPLELTRRRPDILQAEALALAADRDFAEAIRNKYPRLTLNLSAQARSNTYNDLFNEWAYTLAGNFVAPLIYGGRLRAAADEAEAQRDAQIFQYGQTVLNAFQEVENALVREQKQKERITVLEERLDLAQKINRQLRNEFINGLSDYLDILLALDQEQQLRRDRIDARLRQLEIRVALYRALAGGFETEREAENKENL